MKIINGIDDVPPRQSNKQLALKPAMEKIRNQAKEVMLTEKDIP